MTSILIKMGDLDTETDRHTQREGDLKRHRGKTATYKPGREAGADPFLMDRRRTRTADIPVSDFQPPEP